MFDRYGLDALVPRAHANVPEVPATLGLVVEDTQTGWCGAIVAVEKAGGIHTVHLEDRHGKVRAFPLGYGFLIEGRPVQLIPAVAKIARPSTTNSGSRAIAHKTQVARPSRIWVEGIHDAELVEYVWGDDLRVEGIVVEVLHGIDNLISILEEFSPSAGVKAGILVDHMITGSKEARIAQQALQRFGKDALLITGHPFVDIWQAIKPARFGLESWPEVPKNIDIKVGTLRALGLPARSQADIAAGWKTILHRVRDFRDLEPELLGPVESLIDFVTT